MIALQFPKSLPDFQRIFPNDAACAKYHHDSVSYEIELPGQAGVTFTLDRTRRLRKGALLAVFLLALLPAPASALEGFRCQHSTQCERFELCVADSPSSTWGTCRALKILP